ncbi:unnamed protein product [Arctogadus glacialis]
MPGAPPLRSSPEEVRRRAGGGGEALLGPHWVPVPWPGSPGPPGSLGKVEGGESAVEAESRWSILNDTVGPPADVRQIEVFQGRESGSSVLLCGGAGVGQGEGH